MLFRSMAGLDPVVTSQLYELLLKLNKEGGITIVMVSHDIAAAIKYANVILHLDTTSLFFGTTADYRKTKVFKGMIGGGSKDD